MNSSRPGTREKLLLAATRLFAEHGYAGASVRDICNHAGANPGAVSYHFNGKRHLYRAVLRHAAEHLASGLGASSLATSGDSLGRTISDNLDQLLSDGSPSSDLAIRLILHDLASGGAATVEAIVPALREGFARLSSAMGVIDQAEGAWEVKLAFLQLAAPVFLLTAAWPVLQQALDLEHDTRSTLLRELLERAQQGIAPPHPLSE